MDVGEVRAAIQAAGAPWEAGDTGIADIVAATGSMDFGLSISEPELDELRSLASQFEAEGGFLAAGPPPDAFDWRSENVLTGIRNQLNCGSCVAFATCATLEARARRLQPDLDPDFNLSEADLFFCGCGPCCDTGWNPVAALTRAQVGIGAEADFPYTPQNQPCKEITPILRVPSWTLANTTAAQKQAIASNGPVMAGIQTYGDFVHYKSGVYEHVTGDQGGKHLICVVGYDDPGGFWIIKNSWSTSWGEDGFGRIRYGELGLGSLTPFFDPEVELLQT